MSTAAVLLAAGRGARWSGPTHKLLAPLRGHTVLAWSLAHAIDAGLDETIVVVGDEAVRAVLSADVHVVHCTTSARGLSASLHAGVLVAGRHGHDAVVVGLADQPLVGAEAWRRVAAAEGPIAVATFVDTGAGTADAEGARVRRPPVRLDREVWPLLPRRGDLGARALLAARPDLVREVPCPGDPTDIDAPEDLARVR